MVNPIAFHSQSANLCSNVDLTKKSTKEPKKGPKPLMLKHRKSLAIFLGDSEQGFIDFGKDLGFQCMKYDKTSDPSHIVQAKVVIAQQMQYHFIHWIELINLAVSYGIPTVWVHSILPPGRWMWNFRYCLVGLDVKPVDLWRKICQEIM